MKMGKRQQSQSGPMSDPNERYLGPETPDPKVESTVEKLRG